jgi:hypothetical protein
VKRTAIGTAAAVVWTFFLTGSNWSPVDDVPLAVLQFAVPLLLGGPPLANLVLAVRDGRHRKAKDRYAAEIGYQLVMGIAGLINMFLLGIALLFSAMLINGPMVG